LGSDSEADQPGIGDMAFGQNQNMKILGGIEQGAISIRQGYRFEEEKKESVHLSSFSAGNVVKQHSLPSSSEAPDKEGSLPEAPQDQPAPQRKLP